MICLYVYAMTRVDKGEYTMTYMLLFSFNFEHLNRFHKHSLRNVTKSFDVTLNFMGYAVISIQSQVQPAVMYGTTLCTSYITQL